MTKTIALLAALCVIAGCVSAPVKQALSFDPEQFERYSKPGTAQVMGEAFMRTRGGSVRTAAGLRVYLVPLTDYTNERGEIMWRGDTPEAADPRLDAYTKSTTADARGIFVFSHLPAGNYLIYTEILWELSDGSSTGGFAIAKVRLGDGDRKRVIVTR